MLYYKIKRFVNMFARKKYNKKVGESFNRYITVVFLLKDDTF